MQPIANPQGSALTEDTRVLAELLQIELGCKPEKARRTVARAAEPHQHRDGVYRQMGTRYELRKLLLEYRSRAQSPPPHPQLRVSPTSSSRASKRVADDETAPGTDDDDESDDDDGLVEVCPTCGTTRLDTQLIQTRGGDEGATKFTKCLNPDCAAHLIRPVLRRKTM